jgi:hypothetical protein
MDVEEETLASAVKEWVQKSAQATALYDGDKEMVTVMRTETDVFVHHILSAQLKIQQLPKEYLHPTARSGNAENPYQ